MRFIYSLVLLFCFSTLGFSTTITSNGTGGGDWGSASTWSPSVPDCGDTVMILTGDVVTIEVQQDYSSCTEPLIIFVDGVLDFSEDGPKLKLPCGSILTLNAGGDMTSSSVSGSGSANYLDICGDILWQKGDGDTTGFAVFGTGESLPIELIIFEASHEEGYNQLYWSTASEINNDYFTIEHSIDGINFEDIAIISGVGNSSTRNDYGCSHHNYKKGSINYYRLKQTDFDGVYKYHKTISVNNNNQIDFSVILYPNPTNDNFIVSSNDNKINRIRIVDIRGRVVYDEFYYSGKVDISNLPKGTYVVEIYGNRIYRKSIIKS